MARYQYPPSSFRVRLKLSQGDRFADLCCCLACGFNPEFRYYTVYTGCRFSDLFCTRNLMCHVVLLLRCLDVSGGRQGLYRVAVRSAPTGRRADVDFA
jgi:hypothetical protein